MGAGNGIGLRYAEAFAAEGASVTIADIDGAAAAAAARRRVDDLVEFVLLLCSDSAAFLTGQTVTVDGGFVKRI
jgi:NAD(P)-dependent dehydrogenase (short-subunit alcohol dehydrogenase family)